MDDSLCSNLITVLHAILMSMTPLVRLLVVFHFLRQALGTQTAPFELSLAVREWSRFVRFRGANREYGAQCLCDPVADSAERALGRESQR